MLAADNAQVVEGVAKELAATKTSPFTPNQTSTEFDGNRSKTNNRDKQSYLEERAKHVEMPSAEEAEMVPKYLFDDPVFIIHMCNSCRAMSRTLPAFKLDDEHQKIELKLCRICRATHNGQRRIKFFKHDVLCAKRKSENRKFDNRKC